MSAAPDYSVEERERPAEADRLEGFARPRETGELIGHGAAEAQLLDAFKSNRLHHGWLITGPEGIGKATLAYRFARFLLASERERVRSGGGLGIDPAGAAFARVAALSHPNLLVLRRPWSAKRERFAQDITVDEVRGLRPFLGNTAGSDGWRVVVVDRADDLNANAANALLKALEEPPPACVFLLISSTPGRLPLTIRSRCRSLALTPLGEDDLRRAVLVAIAASGSPEPDETTLARCVPLAQGSVRDALQLIANDALALYGELIGALKSLPRLDHRALHKFAEAVAARGAEARYELALGLLEGLFLRLMRHAATGQGAIGEEAGLSQAMMSASSLARWAELWETVQRSRTETTALNLDRKSFVLGTFFRIEEVARREMTGRA